MDGREVITLEFNANAAVEDEYDEIIIQGVPSIHQKILGGVHGDIGTVAMTINTVPKVVQAVPGLVIMKDLPPVTVTQ
jgi:4-hydroxy-tetrahydrodipicolinate reductase